MTERLMNLWKSTGMSQLRKQGEDISQFISTQGEEHSMDIILEPKSTHGAITKTMVPVRLYQDRDEKLVCRSFPFSPS